MVRRQFEQTGKSFNRTIIELKHNSFNFERTIEGAFNRTIIELKLLTSVTSGPSRLTFNRTIIELKRHGRKQDPLRVDAFNRTIIELKLCCSSFIANKSKLLLIGLS